MRISGLRIVAVALLGATVFSACGSEKLPPPVFGSYVALGDSYTAAPGVSPVLGTGDCGRSKTNYPAVLAKKLRTKLTDVSCSGARVQDLIDGQKVTGQVLPPQLDALTAKTDLVTLGIGGNDLDLMGLASSCILEQSDCLEKVGRVEALLVDLPGRIASLVTSIRTRAPKAKVVLVGYPTIVSAKAPCPSLPVPAQIVTTAIDLNARLVKAIRKAAAETRTTFVDMLKRTQDHGVCASDPWIAGIDGKGAQVLHPTQKEQNAVAAAVQSALTKRDASPSS